MPIPIEPKPSVIDLLRNRWMRVILEGVGIIAFFWLISRLSAVLTPVLIGLILAYMLDPLVTWLSRRGASRKVATTTVFGTGALILVAGLVFGVPKAWHEGRILYRGAVLGDAWTDSNGDGRWQQGEPLVRDINGNGIADPSYVNHAHDFLVSRGLIGGELAAVDKGDKADKTEGPLPASPKNPPVPTDQVADSTGIHANAAAASDGMEEFDVRTWIKDTFKDASKRGTILHKIGDVLGRIGFWLLVLLLIPIYGYFFSLNLPLVSRTIMEHIPLAHRDRTLRILAEIHVVVGAFFRGRVVICLILAIVAAIGFAVAQVPSWLVLAALMGVATAIPLAPILVMVPVAMLLYLSGADQWNYIAAAITYAVVQGLEPVLIAVIMGKGVEMHPVILVVAILAFGTLFGAAGALLAVPLAATARILAREFLYPQVRRLAGLDDGEAVVPPALPSA